MKVGILSVVPSPYQRDLFRAMADHPGMELSVFYLEASAPDSPWPDKPLNTFEFILPGRSIGKGRVRCHFNSNLPDPHQFDAFIVNTSLTAMTTQAMFRRLRNHRGWFFWGELLRQNSGVKSLIQRCLSRSIERAQAIVAIGSKAQVDYQRRFPGSHVEQLPYYCDLAAFDRPSSNNQVPVFLFCGQMIERKGVDLLIQAFQQMRDHGVAARLILAGRETDLAKNLHPDVELAGFQSPDCLPDLFARSDVFILPSRHDGWGVVINQAIGAGLPIISTNAVGAACDLVNPQTNGLIVPSGELEPLINAMTQLATDGQLRQRMSAESAKLANQIAPSVGAEKWHRILSCASC